MLITESNLRKIIAEEFAKLMDEARGRGWKPRPDPINVMSKEEEKEYKKKYGEKEDARVPRKARGGDDYRKGDD